MRITAHGDREPPVARQDAVSGQRSGRELANVLAMVLANGVLRQWGVGTLVNGKRER